MVVSRLCLLLIGQRDCHTPQRVQNLLCVLVTHRVFRGAVQQLCKEVLDLFHNGLLFFLGQVGIFRQPLGELLAALLRAGFTTDEVKDHLADVCKFNISAILVMAPIALASMMEHIGDMSAISATVGENFIEDPGLHRTLIGDGLATSLSALVGGPANTTYGENTGVLELSKVHDPKVIRIAALYAIILSFIPKMAEVIGSMPSAIIGGVSFMLYGMISAIGVRNVVENHVDFTKSRNLIIAGVIFVSALGFSNGLTFTVAGTDITLTSLAIAAIAGILLNAILPGNDYHFGKDVEADSNRGIDMMPNLHEDTSYGDHEE